ncbi:MAG: putative glyoxalase superfamily protein PhnB [Patiriisocius sp.]|jgi:uncharacterized glyoxalase superfamily protein PhnB
MKTQHLLILAFTFGTTITSASVFAEHTNTEKSTLDMSDPTDVYTYLGTSYGSEGMNLKGQLMLSGDTDGHGQKSGIIFELRNVFNEGDKDAKFTGIDSTGATFNDEVANSSYRLRYGTIDTTTGVGWSIDAVLADHPFFGDVAVVQAGPVMTIPVAKSFYVWPILYAGVVLTDDNIQDLNPQAPAELSSGVDIASTVLTLTVYARYTISDHWWILANTSYTSDVGGKSWDDNVSAGGLQLESSTTEISLGYQKNQKQNVRLYVSTTHDDSLWLEYNHAF